MLLHQGVLMEHDEQLLCPIQEIQKVNLSTSGVAAFKRPSFIHHQTNKTEEAVQYLPQSDSIKTLHRKPLYSDTTTNHHIHFS